MPLFIFRLSIVVSVTIATFGEAVSKNTDGVANKTIEMKSVSRKEPSILSLEFCEYLISAKTPFTIDITKNKNAVGLHIILTKLNK